MLVSALDGRAIRVRRQWLPWRLRARHIDTDGSTPDFLIDADGLEGVVFGLVLTIIFVLFGGVILTVAVFASEALLLVLLLVPLFAIARILWVLPWVIEATNGDTVLGRERVRGWRDSSERIRDIAAAYERGQDPFQLTTPST
jgi:hypothetical protein